MLTHGRFALEANLKHVIVLRGECKLSFWSIFLGVKSVARGVCDLQRYKKAINNSQEPKKQQNINWNVCLNQYWITLLFNVGILNHSPVLSLIMVLLWHQHEDFRYFNCVIFYIVIGWDCDNGCLSSLHVSENARLQHPMQAIKLPAVRTWGE